MKISTLDILLPSEISGYLSADINDTVKYFHLNVLSAKNKLIKLELLFKQFGLLFDVIMLFETWYTNKTDIFKLRMCNSHV